MGSFHQESERAVAVDPIAPEANAPQASEILWAEFSRSGDAPHGWFVERKNEALEHQLHIVPVEEDHRVKQESLLDIFSKA
jgi:hypothetical protein